MVKKVKTIIKLNIAAGVASAAPPVGPALGQHGLPIMDFVKAFNDKTADQKGNVLPTVITVYEDRTFSFQTKKPPVAEMIKKSLSLEKGSSVPNRDKIGKLSKDQLHSIAGEKLIDLNTDNIESAEKIVQGVARSMGVETE
ncbi:50S ribosomal protein L11 [Patescibacteria group bacterium]|nr:50S ribosomal protein L11 [Patescibacteria group bacterium]